MKLLPKKEIDTLKQKERKVQVDEGLKLATSVEKLRELRLAEEKNLREYRERAINEIQTEIASLIEDRDNLFKWNTEARAERVLLLAPLDQEWEALNLEKEQVTAVKQSLYLDKERLLQEQQQNIKQKETIANTIKKVTKIEQEAELALKEAQSLKDQSENEYRLKKTEHDIQTEEYGKRLATIDLMKATYENGLNVTEMENQRLKDWEDELIIREQDLARRITNLQRTEGVTNGNIHSSSNESDSK
jgi:predicted DNA binding CopG/RHH family protein